MQRVKRALSATLVAFTVLLAGPGLVLVGGPVEIEGDWAQASHNSTGLAPSPATTPEAVVQVYAARAFEWRGAFAVHTWIAAKPAEADAFMRYEVIGWRLRGGNSAVSVSNHRAPDAEWFGAEPVLLRDLRGEAAEAVIEKLPGAAALYPYPDQYRAWPGPNSNTFTAWVGREIPELDLVLPTLAVGKDWLGDDIIARTPAGGWQISLGGIAGVLVGPDEGLELNVLGLVVGASPDGPALALPGIGRVGPDLTVTPRHDALIRTNSSERKEPIEADNSQQ
jgi:hypothetical protein